MASPQKQRQMNRLFAQEKALLKDRFRLEREAQIVHTTKETAMSDLQTAQRRIAEAREACSIVKSRGATGNAKTLCGSLRMRQKAHQAAKRKLHVASRAVESSFRGYEKNTKDVENVQATINSMKTYYWPRPSVWPCRHRWCRRRRH